MRHNITVILTVHCCHTLVHSNVGIVCKEVGYSIGSCFTSLSGFTAKSSTGSVHLIALGLLLKERGYDIWDLGMGMAYKYKLGAVDLIRHDFLAALYKRRNRTATVKPITAFPLTPVAQLLAVKTAVKRMAESNGSSEASSSLQSSGEIQAKGMSKNQLKKLRKREKKLQRKEQQRQQTAQAQAQARSYKTYADVEGVASRPFSARVVQGTCVFVFALAVARVLAVSSR